MVSVNFFPSTVSRRVAGSANIALKNRFAEANPVLNDGPVSLLARPGLKKWIEVGDGHIRKLYNQPGMFEEALFVMSGLDLYKVLPDGTSTNLGTISNDLKGAVSMAATAPIGDTPGYLFVAEGGVLWVYTENSSARQGLTASGAIANNDVITIDGIYYKWTNGSVDTGTPAGTVGDPYLVALGVSNAEALDNMYHAINATGIAGTQYSTVITTAHTTVFASSVSTSVMYVTAIVPGGGGNTIAVTETGANIAWGAATLASGGTAALQQIQLPDDIGAVSVAHINSYVIVVPVQTDVTRGRFYWINPGEIQIDPLDYATAERSPDGIFQVVVFGDYFWLLGQDTTEPWLTTGDPAAPMARFNGILYDRGTSEGTGIQVKDSLILVDQDGGVFQLGQGSTRISSPDIEERIRLALQRAAIINGL